MASVNNQAPSPALTTKPGISHFISAEMEILDHQKIANLLEYLDKIFSTGKNIKERSIHLTLAVLSVPDESVGLLASTLQDWKTTFLPSEVAQRNMIISGSAISFLDFGSLVLHVGEPEDVISTLRTKIIMDMPDFVVDSHKFLKHLTLRRNVNDKEQNCVSLKTILLDKLEFRLTKLSLRQRKQKNQPLQPSLMELMLPKN